MVLVRSVYSLQYFTGLLDITLMSWISLNDSHVLFNLFVSRENHATTVIVSLQTVMTLWQSLLAVKFSATCHQMATLAFRLHKIQFRPGLRPAPRWGSLRRSPRHPSRLGRGIPPPHSLDAFGVSLSTPSASRLGAFGTEIPQLLKRCRAPEREPPSFFKLL